MRFHIEACWQTYRTTAERCFQFDRVVLPHSMCVFGCVALAFNMCEARRPQHAHVLFMNTGFYSVLRVHMRMFYVAPAASLIRLSAMHYTPLTERVCMPI